jgi:hypothetical protein
MRCVSSNNSEAETHDRASMTTDKRRSKNFMFRIGPFGEGRERHWMYFLEPGNPEHPGAEAVADHVALKALLPYFPADELVVEPQMRQAGAELGVASHAFDDDAAHALGLIAMELLDTTPVREIEHEWLVFAMLQSARMLQDEAARIETTGSTRFALDFVGDLRFRAFGSLDLDAGVPRRLALYNSVEERERGDRAAAVEADPMDGDNSIELRFRDDNAVVLDALRRAHGLHLIPDPYLVTNGEQVRVQDNEALILAVALNAASQVIAGKPSVEAFAQVDEMRLGARLAKAI